MQTIQQTILPAQAPATADFIDIKNNHVLLRYFQNLQQRFMYANNFGLALDDEDIPSSAQPQAYLSNLFVPPHLSENHYHPEQLITLEQQSQSQNWLDVAQVLKDNPRLFILGDPGAGKSTLLSWLMLSLSHSGDNLTKMMIGERIPFLLVLRDLPLSQVTDWDTLWQVFLDSNGDKLTTPLNTDPDIVATLFKNGQALLLIDGLDEVTQPQVRQQLGQAVLEGINRYSRCGFVITSRLLGFDQEQWFGLKDFDLYHRLTAAIAAIEKNRTSVTKNKSNKEQSIKRPLPIILPKNSKQSKWALREAERLSQIYNATIFSSRFDEYVLKDWPFFSSESKQSALPVFYLAPFDITQTQQFINNWYRQYLSNDKALLQRITELQHRIIQHDGLGHLARVPVLLNMICFIHSRRGRLPDGRAELYQRIAETYLTSLDRARGLKFRDREFNYDYLDLCEWLGKLALKLQDNRNKDDQSLLIDQQQVKALLQEELTNRGMSQLQIEEEVEFILAYIAQRSGLFIPRGKNITNQEQYGFTHLSFLEYFAALSLKLEAQIDAECLTNRRITTAYPWWHECWALFFEQLEHSRLAEKYLNQLFSESLDLQNSDSLKQALSLAKIIMDSGVRLAIQTRHTQIKNIWTYYLAIEWSNSLLDEFTAFCELMWSERFDSRSISVEQIKANNTEALALTGTTIDDLSLLSELSQLKRLVLQNTSVSDLSPLSGLNQLIKLNLDRTAIRDLSALSELNQLNHLSLNHTAISELSPLAGLKQLSWLVLNYTAVYDLSALAGLNQLVGLFLSGTAINDLSPLAGLERLTYLFLSATAISDLSPLAELNQLEVLYLRDTAISDLSPLAELNCLTELKLSRTAISDLSPLVGLSQLTELDLSNTVITDLSPLVGLSQLRMLNLSNTVITDLKPLAGLSQLTDLRLSNTAINDLTPLSKLNNLKDLYLPSKEIKGLKYLNSKKVNLFFDN